MRWAAATISWSVLENRHTCGVHVGDSVCGRPAVDFVESPKHGRWYYCAWHWDRLKDMKSILYCKPEPLIA